MTTTRMQRRTIVSAAQMTASNIDLIPNVPQELLDQFYQCCDDGKIGGENRKALASVLKKMRRFRTLRNALRVSLVTNIRRISRNPRRYRVHLGCFRLYPHTVIRKGTSAKTHPDCQYCGVQYVGEVVCGVCHEAGIDGKVIRGTEARRETTYVEWRKNR